MAPPWTAVEAASENVSKKMLLAYMQENCDAAFLQTHKLGGQPNGVLKRVTKDAMVDAYKTHLGGGSKDAPAPAFKFEPAAPAGGAGSPKAPFTFSPPAGGPAPTTGGLFGNAPDAKSPGSNFTFNFNAPPSGGSKNDAGDDDDDDEDDDDDDDFVPGSGKGGGIGAALAKRMAALNMSAAQRRDATLSELPPKVRERVEKLEGLQEKTDALAKEFEEKLRALRLEYEGKYAPMYKERSGLVKGDGSEGSGVPGFWLQALQNNVMLAEEIQRHDEPVLAYLMDIKTSTKLSDDKQGFQLAFVFATNPYFSNAALTKTYLMDPDDEDECLERAVGCEIEWNEGMNVSVKTVQKKQKKKGKVRTVKVEEPCDSFFQFFDPPEPPEEAEEVDEEEMEQLQEEMEHDYEVGCLIKDKVVPRACAWFTGMAIDPAEEFDDDEDDDEDDDDDDDDDDEDDDDDDDDDDEEEDVVDTRKMKKEKDVAKPKPGQGGPGPEGEQECKQQ